MKSQILFAGLVALVLAAGCTKAPEGPQGPVTTVSNRSATPAVQSPPDAKPAAKPWAIHSMELAQLYEDNQLQGAKWDGRTVIMKGIVGGVERDHLKLSGVDLDLNTVNCYWSNPKGYSVLIRGDYVIVKGHCVGHLWLGGVKVDHAELVYNGGEEGPCVAKWDEILKSPEYNHPK